MRQDSGPARVSHKARGHETIFGPPCVEREIRCGTLEPGFNYDL
jgi:hypothetical protein